MTIVEKSTTKASTRNIVNPALPRGRYILERSAIIVSLLTPSEACSIFFCALAKAAVGGDSGALNDLITGLQKNLIATARAVLKNRDDAEDVVQDALTAVLVKPDALKRFASQPRGVIPFLHATVKNKALNVTPARVVKPFFPTKEQLVPFGCHVVVMRQPQKVGHRGGKLSPTAYDGAVVGYDECGGYIILMINPKTGAFMPGMRLHRTRNVRVYPGKFICKREADDLGYAHFDLFDDDDGSPMDLDYDNMPPPQPPQPPPDDVIPEPPMDDSSSDESDGRMSCIHNSDAESHVPIDIDHFHIDHPNLAAATSA